MKIFLPIICFATTAFAQDAPPATEQIPDLVTMLQEAIADKRAAGGVILVADREGTAHFSAQGWSDIAAEKPMKKDSLFWIASQTKPITGVAAMMLVEEGKLDLDTPVSRYLPEFRELKDADGEVVEVTVRQCLNHTSGLSDLPYDVRKELTTLQQLVEATVKLPTLFAPGTDWKYCQTGINTVGRIIEVQSGMLLPEFFQTRIFGPLDMPDTMFYPTEELVQKRLAKSYHVPDMNEVPIGFLAGKSPADRDRYPMANGGLFSTASDLEKFCRMVLNKGEAGELRLLSEDSVDEMLRISTGDLDTGFTPGNGWAAGWCVIRDPQGTTAPLASGSFGHGGAHGTQMWIDPVAGRIDILMVQRTGIKNGDAAPLRANLHRIAAGR